MSRIKKYWLVRIDRREVPRGPFRKKRAFRLRDLLIGEWLVVKVIDEMLR